jgi:hypothetical protein
MSTTQEVNGAYWTLVHISFKDDEGKVSSAHVKIILAAN